MSGGYVICFFFCLFKWPNVNKLSHLLFLLHNFFAFKNSQEPVNDDERLINETFKNEERPASKLASRKRLLAAL